MVSLEQAPSALDVFGQPQTQSLTAVPEKAGQSFASPQLRHPDQSATDSHTQSGPAQDHPDPQLPAESAECHLLELPAELRNDIYRLALVQDSDIDVNHTRFAKPALLSTCKQIRHEACKIFYAENDSRIHVPDYDCSALCKWNDLQLELNADDQAEAVVKNLGRLHITGASWPNLMTWLQRTHAGQLLLGPAPPAILVAVGVLSQVMHLIGFMGIVTRRSRDLPWSEVEKTFEYTRSSLIMIDEKWGKD